MPAHTVEELKEPTTKDDKVRRFRLWFDAAARERSRYDLRWESDRDFSRGKIDNINLPQFRSNAHVNDLHMVIQRGLAILTDNRPAFDVGGRGPEDDRMAEIIKALIVNVYDKNDLLYIIPDIITDKLTIGTGIWKVDWDEDFGPDGNVRLRVVNPKMFYIAPEALDIKNARYVQEIIPMTLHQISRRWPDRVEDVKQMGRSLMDRDRNEPNFPKTTFQNVPFLVTTVNGITRDLSGKDREVNVFQGGDLLRVVETWYTDDEVKGRRSYFTGDIFLEDEEAPYRSFEDKNDRNEWPYVKDVDIVVPHEFWGMGEVEQLEKIIWAKTTVLRRLIDWINLTVSPQVLFDTSTGLDPTMLTNKPNTAIPIKPGRLNGVKWREVPPMPSGLFGMMDFLTTSIETVSGIQDVTQGRKPGSVVAGKAIAALQEAAQTFLRLKARNTEAALKRVAEFIVARIQQFYKQRRVIRTVGDTGKLETIFLQTQQTMQAGEQAMPTAPDRFGFNPDEILNPETGRFDIRMEAGSMLPVSKSFQADLTIQLMGIMDQRTGRPMFMTPTDALKRLQFQDAEQMQDRVRQESDIVQMLQQQLQQAQEQTQQISGELEIQNTESTQLIQKVEAEIDRLRNNIESLQRETRIKDDVFSAQLKMLNVEHDTDKVLSQIETESAADRRIERIARKDNGKKKQSEA